MDRGTGLLGGASIEGRQLWITIDSPLRGGVIRDLEAKNEVILI
jgi:hypothetical protein